MAPSFAGMSYPVCEGVLIKEVMLKIKVFSLRWYPNFTWNFNEFNFMQNMGGDTLYL